MGQWWWFPAGLAVGAPVWIALTLWLTRRNWRSARKLSARSKGREQLAELGQLASGLAHEIKNPLSTINVNLQLLSEDIARFEDSQHQRLLRRIESVQAESNRLNGILNDFLHYAGKCELTLEMVDLRRVVSELADFFAPQAEAAMVIMRTMMPEEPTACRVDVKLIKQALLNLMINAVQAIGQGGELIVKLSTTRGQAIIEVIDTGPGIAADELDRIFNVYYSTKRQGTGLGLATTRRIIREHGGGIRVESEVGKGARFLISLPLVQQQ